MACYPTSDVLASVAAMTETTSVLSESIRRARELERAKSEERVSAVERVAEAAHNAVTIESDYRAAQAAFEAEWNGKVRAAHAEHERAWSGALSAGWTVKELRQVQVPEPGKAAPRSRRKTAVKPTTATAETHPEE